MSRAGDPRGLLDRLVAACFTLLVAAVAVYVAARLIESVWPVLLIVLIVGVLLAAGIAIIRSRFRGW